jgi:Heparinase II/III-like protein
MRLLTLVRTAAQIGKVNCARVALYRAELRAGLFKRTMPVGKPVDGPFIVEIAEGEYPALAEFAMFGWREVALNPMPDWHASPFFPGVRADDRNHWSLVPDFSAELGDIKAVWELSRFDWAPQLAYAASQGKKGKAVLLEMLVRDWAAKNPFSRGANWRCAQEASLRLLNLLFAAAILGLDAGQSHPALRRFVAEHVRRILPTTSYAIGQQNNHATSESAGLAVAGMWLEATADPQYQPLAAKAQKRGRQLFEKGVLSLVMDDGCFAQYSVNYHRLFLATAVVLDGFRRKFGKPDFSSSARGKLARAAMWLKEMVDPATGLAPLLGANDGANILNPAAAPYRDMRPVSEAASLAFTGREPQAPPLLLAPFPSFSEKKLVEIDRASNSPALVTLKNGRVKCFLRLPAYRFRPSQADCLHLDVWIDGRPFLVDAGTVTYADAKKNAELSGISAHNTVALDGREPMPRLGRFLFGDWIGLKKLEITDSKVMAAYSDRFGATHARTIILANDHLEVLDEVSGYVHKAVLSWRLAGSADVIDDNTVGSSGIRISFQTDGQAEIAVVQAAQGEHYLRNTTASVVRIIGQNVRKFVTIIDFPSI